MRIKQNKSRAKKAKPASFSDRRRSKRWASAGSRGRSLPRVQEARRPSRGAQLGFVQWIAFLTIVLISGALIALIWMLTGRAIEEETADIRGRTEQQARSVAYALSQDLYREMLTVDQSLTIIQEAWKKDPAEVDLGAWRKQSIALTSVADDIFISNERGIIVQGTLPQSIGQGFGSAYVSYPNGSLELYEPDGTKTAAGRTNVSSIEGTRIEARQYLIYVVRPLGQPAGFMTGAIFRSQDVVKMYAGANLGEGGTLGFVDLNRGMVEAIVGSTARNADMDISKSELAALMRKSESGVWNGPTPTDKIDRVIAFQRVPGRPLAVIPFMVIAADGLTMRDRCAGRDRRIARPILQRLRGAVCGDLRQP